MLRRFGIAIWLLLLTTPAYANQTMTDAECRAWLTWSGVFDGRCIETERKIRQEIELIGFCMEKTDRYGPAGIIRFWPVCKPVMEPYLRP